jgi:Uma2 family endonuclease
LEAGGEDRHLMRVPVVRKNATYADIEALPEHMVGELIEGELHVSPRPATLHSRAASRVGTLLGPFDGTTDGPGGWIILDGPELHFGDRVVVPDVAGWRRERMPELPDVPYLELAPDWVCEVLSPSTERLDRVKKMPLYAEVGVQHAWLVDPIVKTLEVYRRDQAGRWLLLGTHTEGPVRAEPFEAIGFDLSALWGR